MIIILSTGTSGTSFLREDRDTSLSGFSKFPYILTGGGGGCLTVDSWEADLSLIALFVF